MLEIVEQKLKIKKWEWIPVIGTMIYSVRFEMFINFEFIGSKIRKIIKKYRSIWNLFFMMIALAFLITFFVVRDKNGFGHWPWPFWVGLGIGLGQSLIPIPAKLLFQKGINDFKKLPIEEQQKLIEIAIVKKEEFNSLRNKRKENKK